MGRNRTARTLAALVTAAALSTAGLVITTTSSASADLAKPTSTAARHVDRSTGGNLVAIRHAKHDTFDRIVFELKGGAPGYDVRYVSTVRYDPSDKPVSMMGRAYLQVVLHGASAYDLSGRHTYSGLGRAYLSYPTLKGWVINGDFERVLSIALGLSKKAGFRVFTLSNPTRIVVDVAH